MKAGTRRKVKKSTKRREKKKKEKESCLLCAYLEYTMLAWRVMEKRKVYHLSNLNMFTKRLESCLLIECYFLSVSVLKEEQLITAGHVLF